MHHRVIAFLSLCSLGATSLVAAEVDAGNWPKFRGTKASGLSAGAKPPIKFGPTDGVVWNVDVPWSPSSPAICGERIFLTTFRNGELKTSCHSRAEGKLLWAGGVKPGAVEDFHRADGSPAASSPATDGRHVLSYFGSFDLICHDVEGKDLWRYPLPLALSAGQYGSGTSPIIIGETVVPCRDLHRYSTLLALDVKSGRKLWETPRPDASGSFGTPVHSLNNGVDEIVAAADGRLYVAPLLGKLTVIKSGGDKPEVLHQVDFGERILATPALVGERLYVRTTTKLWAFGKQCKPPILSLARRVWLS